MLKKFKNFLTTFRYRNWKYCKHCGKELKVEEEARWFSMKTGELIKVDYYAVCPKYNGLVASSFPHDYYEYSLEV